MSDLVEDFLAREKDGLAGLESEIPQAFQGKATKFANFSIFLSENLEILENGDGFNDGMQSQGEKRRKISKKFRKNPQNSKISNFYHKWRHS